ncbi:MAG: 3-methyl-2-oxobutanoate dehydrogenase subunit VorB [Spirochaetes bacterium]|nr:3-methyl-2-oxobutanoate dehydrogenase subunit VorB [Spirochaetota bacterium]
MKEKVLMKGNEALAEAAIIAGCRYYFGYPITPQNEIPAYMSWRLPQAGGVFIQAESEVASINMIFGAAAAGGRAMTTTSSPGLSLMMEGISYIAAAELPCVLVNVMRGGPGLGNIAGAQGDYFQAVKGGGHGDYRLIVLAGNSVQELTELTVEAFDMADMYRNPVLLLSDGILGQMSEPLILPEPSRKKMPAKTWALTGSQDRAKNIIRTLWLHPEDAVEKHNIELDRKYKKIKKELLKYESIQIEDAEIILVAYGTSSRVARGVVNQLRKQNIKIGLIRPITLWPFPEKIIREKANGNNRFLVIEMSMGQMVEDVKLAVGERCPVHFLGRGGGWIPSEEGIISKVKEII